MQKYLALLLFLCTSIAFSQNITLTGKVTDPDDYPLESATIYLTTVKDSAVVEYTISDKEGNWEMRTRSKEEPVDLKISFVGFADYRQRLNTVTEDRNFGTLKLKDRSTELNEVVIEGEIPPIRVKSDTLEFNASSFKVRPDANVEALLKQLPGVEIDTDGKITVNGKEVNQILVNGKPFFDKDGKVALQSLPAEIIDKVQVSDTKTKKEEITGQAASGDNASINLTIQEDKNKGFFGKFMGGYGTDDRYESSMLVNYFRGERKISVLASSNNINSTGFSMNEIFDSMGGGRNNSYFSSGNGSFGINGVQFGGGSGITHSDLVGINYSDEWLKDFDSNLNYFYTAADSKNDNRTKLTTYLTNDDNGLPVSGVQRSIITESSSSLRDEKYSHNLNTQFEFKIDSTATIYFDPKFVKANSKRKNSSEEFSINQDNVLLNESNATTFSENDNNTFSSSLEFSKAFKKRKRYISVSLDNENRKDDGADFNQSTTIFYNEDADGDGVPDVRSDVRNQVRYNRQVTDQYRAEVEYAEPITDSLQLNLSVEYRLDKAVEDRDGFNFDESTGAYTRPNDSLTNYLSSSTGTIEPQAGIEVRKDRYTLRFSGGTNITRFENYGTYRGENYIVNKDYVLPSVRGNFRYKFTKSKSAYISYHYNVNFPRARQVLPIEDVSNPLSTTIGNPDLNPDKSHSFYGSYRNFDFATRSGYNFYGGGSVYDSRIVTNTFINSSAKRTLTYTNISGTYNLWAGGYWNKSFKNEGNKYRLNIGMNLNYNFDKGFTNGELYEARRSSISPRVSFTWDHGDLLTIEPSYDLSYNETHYTNYSVTNVSNTVHRFNLQTTSYWPEHFVFGNDFGYTYNSNISGGFRKDFYLWNTSLGYNFLNDKLLFKVKVYDVLNQNVGTSRTITATSVYDQQNTVLTRYAMFSLTFKIEKFGGKEKEDRGSRMWFF